MTSTNDSAAWCSGYLDAILAGAALDSAASGSQEQSNAAMDLEAAFQTIATTPIPDAIEPDWEVVKRGYDVSDAGESLSQAAIRIGEWTVANCNYSPEVVELLES